MHGCVGVWEGNNEHESLYEGGIKYRMHHLSGNGVTLKNQDEMDEGNRSLSSVLCAP